MREVERREEEQAGRSSTRGAGDGGEHQHRYSTSSINVDPPRTHQRPVCCVNLFCLSLRHGAAGVFWIVYIVLFRPMPRFHRQHFSLLTSYLSRHTGAANTLSPPPPPPPPGDRLGGGRQENLTWNSNLEAQSRMSKSNMFPTKFDV